jgi:hypothetical protein
MGRNMTPDQLDPLAASSSPISVEPSAGGADQRAIDMLVAGGMPYPQAVAVVRAEKAKASAGMQARVDAAAAARATPAAPSAPEEEDVSAETIRRYGYMPQAEPGPTSVRGGGKVTPGQQFSKMSEAIGYMTRTPVTDANRAQAYPDAAYLPSDRDRDMAARGFFPVPADDGSVSYSVGTGRDPKYKQDLGMRGIPGAPGRLGPRADLEEEVVPGKPIGPGFTLEPVRGPTGTNYIYKQNEAAQKQQASYMDERQLYRMAKAAGMSPTEFAAANEGAFGAIDDNPMAKARMMVQGARQAAEQKREEEWRSQMMLAGRNPAKNAVNAYNALNDPNTNDWQRTVMANALRPDMDNTTPLTVEAMGAQNALRFLNSTNLGAAGAGGPNNPMFAQAARNAAIARADELIKKYPKSYFGGLYDAADVKAVRDAVELQHPGMGDAAVAHIRIKPASATPSSGPPAPPPAPRPMNGLPPIGR